MRYTSSLRSPKKEEQEVPESITPNFNKSYTHEDFYLLDELEEYLNIEEEQQKISPQNSSGELHWDIMEWDEFNRVGDEAEYSEEKNIKRENNDEFGEVNDEKSVALKLNLNYQEVLDAWSDRGSLWADGCSSLSTNNYASYMGEVPILEEERRRREASVLRYKEKRQNRLFSKKIRYQVRKLNADKRPRIKGRFVKRH
ncbi:zinc finger protein CONSTANS-LIKE 6 isoform X2 [Cicer arietinum]|uniref:Protein CHLOROPLAST IMPORT APPARATUS 2 isoform X2 n=1 Tax=Cicer arietinum TaxID=3827 RepID=A0A1S2XMP2_CICAR|nr:protein CHLOROPLAST IMPORT APPARATUS 2 isoform X2 [Cicer arietinum]